MSYTTFKAIKPMICHHYYRCLNILNNRPNPNFLNLVKAIVKRSGEVSETVKKVDGYENM